MQHDRLASLSYETMLTDPLIRLVMAADGVSVPDFAEVMATARDAVIARDRLDFTRRALSLHATSGRA